MILLLSTVQHNCFLYSIEHTGQTQDRSRMAAWRKNAPPPPCARAPVSSGMPGKAVGIGEEAADSTRAVPQSGDTAIQRQPANLELDGMTIDEATVSYYSRVCPWFDCIKLINFLKVV